MDNRPTSREKYVTDNSKGVAKRETGLNSSSQKISQTGSARKGGVPTKAAGGGGLAVVVAIIIMVVKSIFGGGGSTTGTDQSLNQVESTTSYTSTQTAGNTVSSADGQLTYQDSYVGATVVNNKPDGTSNTGVLDTSSADGTRAKYTTIKGNGNDQVTFMVYICGTDLESKNGMATKDIIEMTKASLSTSVNVIIYTGGCKKWKNNVVSNSGNQIWKISNGGLECLVKDDGDKSMTDPATLTSFIKWCKTYYPANRNELIMWDHGGGAITGYGYDERSGHSGSMTLSKVSKALKDADIKFDFIGFDACLMATLETGLTLEPYADYLIASEETEPGVGWYYTNWLNKISQNPAMPTVELGKAIIDDYVTECNRSCNGQKTSLSIVDLAELKKNVPDKLNAFAGSINDKIEAKDFKSVSDARYETREFAQSSQIDHVDLVDLSKKMNTAEGTALSEAVLSAVKYNRTSSNMTNAYGVSIYFPYRKVNKVDNAVSAYNALGMDSEYTKCIRSFAQVETSGQVASNGTSSATSSLFGISGSNNISTVANAFSFLMNREIPEDEVNDYVEANKFDTSNLKWTEVNGKKVISMPEEQWAMVHDLTINMFYDDGAGYIDLGNDNLFELDDAGNLIGDTEPTWIAIDGQPVAYYYMDTAKSGNEYSIMGRVPVMLNGERTNLIIIFDNDHPRGYIAGARADYSDTDTEAVAKAITQLSVGDKLDFICNYYDYNGNFKEEYYIGEQMTLSASPEISNVPIDGKVKITYKFTDIYNQTYWSEVLE